MELGDDRDTLEAAMALIDEWEWESGLSELLAAESQPRDDDDEQTSSTVSVAESDDARAVTSPSSSPPPASPPTSQTGTKSRRRKADEDGGDKQAQLSRREELILLRRRVRQMEATLASLKQGMRSRSTQEAKLDPVAVWQQLATRQLERRQTAERENLKLRVEMEERLKIAKHLMRVLLRAYEQHNNSNADAGDAKRLKVPEPCFPEESVEDQLHGIQSLYDQREAVFARAPFTGGPHMLRDVRVTDYENGESMIEVDSSWVLPFSVNEVTNASWAYLVRKTAQHFEDTEDLDTKNIFVSKYESRAAALRFIGKFTGSFVAQRFPSDDGQAPAYAVWDMRANVTDFKPMSMDGVRLYSETITRFAWADQATGSPPSSSGRMSLVQVHQRVHIKFAAAETPTRRRRAGALTDFMMYIVETDLKWEQEVLESLLLQSTLPSVPDDASSWTYISLALR